MIFLLFSLFSFFEISSAFLFEASDGVRDICILLGNLNFEARSWHFWSIVNCFNWFRSFLQLNEITVVSDPKSTEDKGWFFFAWSWKYVFPLVWNVHSGQLRYEKSSIDPTFQGLEFIIRFWKYNKQVYYRNKI